MQGIIVTIYLGVPGTGFGVSVVRDIWDLRHKTEGWLDRMVGQTIYSHYSRCKLQAPKMGYDDVQTANVSTGTKKYGTDLGTANFRGWCLLGCARSLPSSSQLFGISFASSIDSCYHTDTSIMAAAKVAKGRRKSGGKPGAKPASGGAKKKPEKTVTKKGRGKGKTPEKKGKTPEKKGKTPEKKGKKPQQQKGGGKGPKGRGKSKGKGGKPTEKKKPLTAEELDKSMDDYWLSSKDKAVAAKKLDDDMDAYWAKKGEAEEETKGDEDKKET